MRIEPIQVGTVQSESPGEAVAAQKDRLPVAHPASSPPPRVQGAPSLVPHREEEIQTKVDGQRIIYRFVDKQTGEVIFQVPSEEMLNVMRGIEEQLHEQTSGKKVDENF